MINFSKIVQYREVLLKTQPVFLPLFNTCHLSQLSTATKHQNPAPPNRFKMMRNQLMDPTTVYVSKGAEKSGTIKLRLLFPSELGGDSRPIQLERKLDESIQSTFERLSLKFNQIIGHTPKKVPKFERGFKIFGQNELEEDQSGFSVKNIQILKSDGSLVNAECSTNAEAFMVEGECLRIGNSSYKILRECPFFEKCNIDTRLFVGYPVLPSMRIFGSNSNAKCYIDWYVEKEANSVSDDEVLKFKRLHGLENFSVDKFTYVGRGLFYNVKEQDIGKRLLILAYPRIEDIAGILYII